MFFKKQPVEKTGLEKAIDELFFEMSGLDGDSEKYAAMVKQMDTLYKLKEVDHKSAANKLKWMEIIVPSAVSLLGILAITDYEKLNVVTSKALNFIPKAR